MESLGGGGIMRITSPKLITKFILTAQKELKNQESAFVVLMSWFTDVDGWATRHSVIAERTGKARSNVSRAFKILTERKILIQTGAVTNGTGKPTPTYKPHDDFMTKVNEESPATPSKPIKLEKGTSKPVSVKNVTTKPSRAVKSNQRIESDFDWTFSFISLMLPQESEEVKIERAKTLEAQLAGGNTREMWVEGFQKKGVKEATINPPLIPFPKESLNVPVESKPIEYTQTSEDAELMTRIESSGMAPDQPPTSIKQGESWVQTPAYVQYVNLHKSNGGA